MYWNHLSKYHICTSWAVQQCAVEEPGRVNNFTTAPYRLTWTAAACRTAPARSTASAASTAATKTWPSLSQPKSARSASRWWRRWRWERARGRLRVLLAGQRIHRVSLCLCDRRSTPAWREESASTESTARPCASIWSTLSTSSNTCPRSTWWTVFLKTSLSCR